MTRRAMTRRLDPLQRRFTHARETGIAVVYADLVTWPGGAQAAYHAASVQRDTGAMDDLIERYEGQRPPPHRVGFIRVIIVSKAEGPQ